MIEDSSKQHTPGTLGEFISQHGPLDAKEAASMLLPLVKDISELHLGGKIHCHICADNVFIDEMKSVKAGEVESFITIGGIGVDLIPCPPQFHNMPPISLPTDIEAAEQTMTKAGILLDPRQIDYYQLGALLCFMTSGHSISQYLRSCKAKAEVPEAIIPVIDRALGLNFRDCFKSGEDFAADLQAIISGEPPIERKTTCIPDSIFDGENLRATSGMHSDGQLPFERLGHYIIIEQIGCGGMGDVYKAHDEALDRFVAIKVLPSQLARQKDFVKRFHAEATAIARLEHPNVVSIYYSGEDQGHHFFAMQYVEGHSLAELLKERGKLSVDEALPIIKQSLAGIGAAHRMGLIHRDIKPGNILLDSSSRTALITDFGVVKTGMDSTQMTVTGTVMGTADYIAPEQARGGKIDNRADLYAMGALMYQMLSGKLPFEAKSATSMMFQHAYEPVRPLSEVAPEVPDDLAEIILKLMNKEPKDRYASTDDVLAAINGLNLHAGRPAGSFQTPQSNQVSQTSQTSIIHVPQYTLPPMPNDLSSLVAKNGIGRLKNRVKDLVYRHAPQVVESLQNTTQQVDGVVSDYERQRNRLAELSKEADAVATDLNIQAKGCLKAAQHAAKQAESASDSAAIRHALDIKQQNEQSAAELSQLAAEQTDQADEIKLQLSKLDAKLAQLRSQRDALNARMNAIGGQISKSNSGRPRRRLIKWIAGIALIFLVMFIALQNFTFFQETVPEDGLIAHWKFDEGSGEVAGDSAGNNPGTIHGAKWTEGISGKALSFDGIDDYVACGSDASLDLTEFTWALWIRRSETGHSDERALISTNGPGLETKGTYGLQIDTSANTHNRMQFVKHYTSVHGGIWSKATVGDSNWHFIGLTRKRNGETVIYIDGKADTWGTIDNSSAFLNFTIGAGNKNYANFKGAIDDVRVYDRVLSEKQIKQLFESFTRPKNNGPIAHWKFSEGEGLEVYDSIGGYHGTITGAGRTKGISGNGIYFNKNGMIDITNSYGHDSPLNLYDRDVTLSAWIYIPEGRDGGTVIARAKPNYVAYRLAASVNGVTISHYDSTMDYWHLIARTKINYDTWYHIAGVYNRVAKRGHVYIDGVEKVSGVIPFNPPSCNATTKIGCISNINENPFQGKVDEVQIYDRALTESEIKILAALGTNELTGDYIISYEPVPPFNPRTPDELNEEFHRNFLGGIFINRYRTEVRNGKLIGHKRTDKLESMNILVDMINKNPRLKLLGARAVNQKQLEAHCALGQVSLPPISNSKNIPVIYAEELAVDGIVIGDKKCTTSYIESLLGKPNQIRDRLLKYTGKSLDFVFSGNGPLSEIHLNNGFKGRLDTGISMASTKQQVFEVYGEPLEKITDKDLHRKNKEMVLYEKGFTSRIYYGNAGLIFWFSGNSINQIVPFKGKMKSRPTQ